MIVSFVFLFFIYIASAQPEARFVLPAVTKCSKQVEAPPIMFHGLLKQRKIPDTDQEKCFMGCLYKEIELTKDGVLDYEQAKGQAEFRYSDNPELLKKAMDILDACKTVTSEEECDLGFKLRECFTKNSEETYIKSPSSLPFEIALTYDSVFTPFSA